MTLIPYYRQSRAKERTISIDEQRRPIVQWAESEGIPLATEIVEQNVSGSKPWRDRELGAAIEACERGEAAGIAVAWQDRLTRENARATAEVWEALAKAGARLVIVCEGLDTATGDHEMLFTIKGAIAREQWKRYRANWQAAKRNATERGVLSGRAVTGYRKRPDGKLEPVPAEARKVLGAFELRAAGVPFTEIGRRFGWAHSTTRQILANETYLGVVRHGAFEKRDAHPAIVPADLFAAVQASRTIREPTSGALTVGKMLQGIARCAGCKRTLKVLHRERADGSRVSSYYCKNQATAACTDRAYVHCDDLDGFVADWFERELQTTRKAIEVVAAAAELELAQRDRKAAQADLDAYNENGPAHDKVLFQRGIDARQRRVNEARWREQECSGRVNRLPLGGSLVDLWADYTPAERRHALAGFLDRIDVSRGASSDLAGNITIVWTDGSIADLGDDEDRIRVAAA